MIKILDLVGIGVGPFNLSLAALLDKTNLDYKFFDFKKEFSWHSEILFKDSDMQTSFLKDLATSIDPTSKYTFLNYLVEEGLFHVFMNTERTNVSRKEFEKYCLWVSQKLAHRLEFSSSVDSVDFDGEKFIVFSNLKRFYAKNLSVGTGLTPRVPECALNFVSKTFFHARSPELGKMDLANKDVVVIGGGQTGLEIFKNAIDGKWQRPKSIKLVTGRIGLQPLDESPFSNEYFTPNYVNDFFDIDLSTKDDLVKAQKLTSDGNTPQYLNALYKDLYRIKYVEGDDLDFSILPSRRLEKVDRIEDKHVLILENHFTNRLEEVRADIVILCTGFDVLVPKALDPIKHKITFDHDARFIINKDFTIKWDGPKENKIFALNFSRHNHGISEPQTSLMAWRSGVVTNTILDKEFYKMNHYVKNFMSFI